MISGCSLSFKGLSYGVKWRCETVTKLRLENDWCRPHHLFNICASYPRLESLWTRNDPESIAARIPRDAATTDIGPRFLSDCLSRLTRLRFLSLNMFYHDQDINASLGASGTLDLTSLPELHTVEVPIRFFVEKQPGGIVRVLCPTAVLPPSLRSLTLFTDLRGVEDRRYERDMTAYFHQSESSTLWFLGTLYNVRQTNFPHLRDVGYHLGDPNWFINCTNEHQGNAPAKHFYYPPPNGQYDLSNQRDPLIRCYLSAGIHFYITRIDRSCRRRSRVA